jgi:hypothetical protein
LPRFARLKFALPLAVAIALTGGPAPWIGYPLSLSRTLSSFPLFLLGLRLGGQRAAAWRCDWPEGRCARRPDGRGSRAWLLRDFDPQGLHASIGRAALDRAAWPGMGSAWTC